jgi:hypothetical protein
MFPDAQQQPEDDLDLSPDDEEEEAEAGVGGEEEEDPYEYDELPLVPLAGENNSPGPNPLNEDLILEGKQHRDKGVRRSSPDHRANYFLFLHGTEYLCACKDWVLLYTL